MLLYLWEVESGGTHLRLLLRKRCLNLRFGSFILNPAVYFGLYFPSDLTLNHSLVLLAFKEALRSWSWRSITFFNWCLQLFQNRCHFSLYWLSLFRFRNLLLLFRFFSRCQSWFRDNLWQCTFMLFLIFLSLFGFLNSLPRIILLSFLEVFLRFLLFILWLSIVVFALRFLRLFVLPWCVFSLLWFSSWGLTTALQSLLDHLFEVIVGRWWQVSFFLINCDDWLWFLEYWRDIFFKMFNWLFWFYRNIINIEDLSFEIILHLWFYWDFININSFALCFLFLFKRRFFKFDRHIIEVNDLILNGHLIIHSSRSPFARLNRSLVLTWEYQELLLSRFYRWWVSNKDSFFFWLVPNLLCDAVSYELILLPHVFIKDSQFGFDCSSLSLWDALFDIVVHVSLFRKLFRCLEELLLGLTDRDTTLAGPLLLLRGPEILFLYLLNVTGFRGFFVLFEIDLPISALIRFVDPLLLLMNDYRCLTFPRLRAPWTWQGLRGFQLRINPSSFGVKLCNDLYQFVHFLTLLEFQMGQLSLLSLRGLHHQCPSQVIRNISHLSLDVDNFLGVWHDLSDLPALHSCPQNTHSSKFIHEPRIHIFPMIEPSPGFLD